MPTEVKGISAVPTQMSSEETTPVGPDRTDAETACRTFSLTLGGVGGVLLLFGVAGGTMCVVTLERFRRLAKDKVATLLVMSTVLIADVLLLSCYGFSEIHTKSLLLRWSVLAVSQLLHQYEHLGMASADSVPRYGSLDDYPSYNTPLRRCLPSVQSQNLVLHETHQTPTPRRHFTLCGVRDPRFLRLRSERVF